MITDPPRVGEFEHYVGETNYIPYKEVLPTITHRFRTGRSSFLIRFTSKLIEVIGWIIIEDQQISVNIWNPITNQFEQKLLEEYMDV